MADADITHTIEKLRTEIRMQNDAIQNAVRAMTSVRNKLEAAHAVMEARRRGFDVLLNGQDVAVDPMVAECISDLTKGIYETDPIPF